MCPDAIYLRITGKKPEELKYLHWGSHTALSPHSWTVAA